MKTAQVAFRTDDGIKTLATQRAKNEGLPLTTVLDAFLAAYATGKIHLNISLSSDTPAISAEESDEMEDGLGPFGSAERREAARKDFESGHNVVSWASIREEMLKKSAS